MQCENSVFFCLPPSYNFDVFGRSDVTYDNHTYQRIAVKLKTCSSAYSECQSYQDNLVIYVFIYNNNIDPHSQKDYLSKKQRRVFQLHGSLELTNSIYLTFYLKKAYFTTDNEIFPTVLTR